MKFPTQGSWSRRSLKLLAVVILCVATIPVFSRLFLYPNTLRAKFDRIQLGMSEAEVRHILGLQTTGPTSPRGSQKLSRLVIHGWEDGKEQISYETEDDAYIAYVLLMHRNRPYFEDPTPLRQWISADGWIGLKWHDGQGLRAKLLVEYQAPNLWSRFRAWLGCL